MKTHYSTPTLLLSGTMPGESGVGDIYLKCLLEQLQNPNIAIAHVSELNEKDKACRIEGAIYRGFRTGYRRFDRFPRWCGIVVEAFRERLVQWYDENRITEEIVDFANKRSISIIWGVLDAPPIYRIARKVSQKLGVPLLVTVWDPPSGVSRLHVRSTIARWHDRRDFDRIMRHAVGAAVISDRMAAEYAAAYRIPVSVVRYGLPPGAINTEVSCQPVTDEFRIAFCGSVYAQQEWEALLAALDSVGWVCNGMPVRLVVAARELPRMKLRGPANITVLGWRPPHEVEAMLRTCHVGYLPYWFSSDYAESVRLCFATKLSNYLAAGLPVLYHGPRSSAVGDFVHDYQVGCCCDTLEKTEIARSIAELINTDRRITFADGIRTAVSKELNCEVFLSRFSELLVSSRILEIEHVGAKS